MPVQRRICAIDASWEQCRDLSVFYIQSGKPGLAIDLLERYGETMDESEDGEWRTQLLALAIRLQAAMN